MSRTFTLALAFLMMVLPASEAARSQEIDSSSAGAPPSRVVGTLGGHSFVPSAFVQDPFVRTYLRTGLGFGMTPNFSTPPVTVNGTTVEGVKGSLLFALMNLEYQHALRDWLAVRGHFKIIGRLADETRPLLAQGVTLYTGFELGWLFRLAASERIFLSASLEVSNSSFTDINLKRFIEGIIEDGGLSPGNSLVEATPTLQGGGGIYAAYAISELVGLTATARLHYGESADSAEVDSWDYLIGAAFDFNLLNQGGPPIGFVVGGRTASTLDVGGAASKSTQTFFGRIGYTGSRDFALGLDLAYELVPVRNLEEKQGFMSALVEIRLYF
jgi:hypothetical protein